MTIDQAKAHLGRSYVMHPAYQPQPQHSSYALVNVGVTFMRVRHRMRQERSFVGAVEQTRTKLRLAYGRAA